MDEDDDDVIESVRTSSEEDEHGEDTRAAANADGAGIAGSDTDSEEERADIRIPKDRFDEERVRRIMAEEEAKRLREMLAEKGETNSLPAPEANIDELEQQAMAAYQAGDDKLYLELRRQINRTIERRAEQRAEERAEKATERALEARDLKRAAKEIEDAYPELNGQTGLLNEVVEYRDFLYHTKKLPLDEALRKAARKVLGEPKRAGQQPVADDDDPGKKRNQAAVKRAADASLRQPPSLATNGVGARAVPGQKSVADMSEEEFDKLTEGEKARIRGDRSAAAR